jgi:DNA-binding CsgD family transcriptional regulator
LEQQMSELLSNGLRLLKKHEEACKASWREFNPQLETLHLRFLQPFHSMVEYAFSFELDYAENNFEQFVTRIISRWLDEYNVSIQQMDLIFLLSIAENVFQSVIAEEEGEDYYAIQSIQYIFTKLYDRIIINPPKESKRLYLLQQIIDTKILPIDWIALIRQDKEQYYIADVLLSDENDAVKDITTICKTIKSPSIQHLSTAIERLLQPRNNEMNAVTLDCTPDYLLLGARDTFLQEFSDERLALIRKVYLRQMKITHLEMESVWKDSIIFYLQRLNTTNSAKEMLQAALKGFTDYMPFKRSYFLLCKNHQDLGIFHYNKEYDQFDHRYIKEMQLLMQQSNQDRLLSTKPKYFPNASDELSIDLVKAHHMKSLILIPLLIPQKNHVIGIVLLDQGENEEFTVSPSTMTTLIKMGQYAAEKIVQAWDSLVIQYSENENILSPREKEVLQLIAKGQSINEAAENLQLSKYTVRDYVSTIMHKMNAKNRTEAAVQAVKRKWI